MKRKFTNTPCCGCIWNNQPKCGKPFCILPRCVERNGLLQSSAKETESVVMKLGNQTTAKM